MYLNVREKWLYSEYELNFFSSKGICIKILTLLKSIPNTQEKPKIKFLERKPTGTQGTLWKKFESRYSRFLLDRINEIQYTYLKLCVQHKNWRYDASSQPTNTERPASLVKQSLANLFAVAGACAKRKKCSTRLSNRNPFLPALETTVYEINYETKWPARAVKSRLYGQNNFKSRQDKSRQVNWSGIFEFTHFFY